MPRARLFSKRFHPFSMAGDQARDFLASFLVAIGPKNNPRTSRQGTVFQQTRLPRNGREGLQNLGGVLIVHPLDIAFRIARLHEALHLRQNFGLRPPGHPFF